MLPFYFSLGLSLFRLGSDKKGSFSSPNECSISLLSEDHFADTKSYSNIFIAYIPFNTSFDGQMSLESGGTLLQKLKFEKLSRFNIPHSP